MSPDQPTRTYTDEVLRLAMVVFWLGLVFEVGFWINWLFL